MLWLTLTPPLRIVRASQFENQCSNLNLCLQKTLHIFIRTNTINLLCTYITYNSLLYDFKKVTAAVLLMFMIECFSMNKVNLGSTQTSIKNNKAGLYTKIKKY